MQIEPHFINDIRQLLQQARQRLVKQVNNLMVMTYFEIGRRIVEQEQAGKEYATYGTFLIETLAKTLTDEFDKGFSATNLKQMRSFYLTFSNRQTVSDDLDISKNKPFTLSWSHYLLLMRITNEDERSFYEIEAQSNGWSVRELERQFDSAIYERLALSRDKVAVKELAMQGQTVASPADIIKDPYILEFLGLPEQANYNETELESAIIGDLENFLLELGKGFTFVGRQVRFTFDEDHFRVDLVFSNRLLRCFVLIDLKIGKLKHQDLGQMQMYVNYYDRYVKTEDENKTIGIVLCKDKKDALVEITLPEGQNQIFASRYQTILPTKEQLKQVIRKDF